MKEKLKLIGQTVHIHIKFRKQKGLKIKVKILDYKSSYGNDRYLVTPVEGSGEVWVENIIK